MAFNSKLLILIFVQFIFCQISYSSGFHNFTYLLCDSLKNANYNFGIKNSKKNFIIYKLKDQSFKKTKKKNIKTALAIIAFMIFLFLFTLYNTGVFDRAI